MYLIFLIVQTGMNIGTNLICEEFKRMNDLLPGISSPNMAME